MEPSETEIIKGCRAGVAFYQKALYKRFAGKMLVVCMRYLPNRKDAEDILQEGFIIVFEKLNQFRGDGSFEGWIRRIMINKSLEHLRKSSFVHQTINIEQAEDVIVYANDILSSIASKDLLNLVQELPPAYRVIFNLYVFEGMKHREIAERLGISEGTSKSNLSDARAILKKRIMPNIIVTQVKKA